MGTVSNGSLLNGTDVGHYNGSIGGKQLVGVTLTESVSIIFSLVIMFVVNLIGNTCAIVAFCKDKKLQTVSNYYVLNLAVCDLIIALFCLPFYSVYIIAQFHWPFGRTFCKFWLVIDFMVCAETTLSIIMISHDRYLLVSQGLEYGKTQTSQRALAKIGFSWICSILLYAPSVAMYDLWRGYSVVHKHVCLPEFHDVIVFNVARVLLEFLISFLIISCLNGALYIRIRRRVRRRARLVAMNMFQSNMSLAPPSPSCNSQNSENQEHPSNLERFSFSSFRSSLRRSKKERLSVKGSRPLLRRTSSLGSSSQLRGSLRRFRSLRRTRSCKTRSIKRSKSERGANGSIPRASGDDANVVIVITAYDSREAVKQEEDDLNGLRMAVSTSCLYSNPAWAGEENPDSQESSVKKAQDSLERLSRPSQGSQICFEIRRRSGTQGDLPGQLTLGDKTEATPRRTSWEALLHSRKTSIEFIEIRRKSEPTKTTCDKMEIFLDTKIKLCKDVKNQDGEGLNRNSHESTECENQPLLANEEQNHEDHRSPTNGGIGKSDESKRQSLKESFKNRMNSLMTDTVECSELEIMGRNKNGEQVLQVPNVPVKISPVNNTAPLSNSEKTQSGSPVHNIPCLLSVPEPEIRTPPLNIKFSAEQIPACNFLTVPQAVTIRKLPGLSVPVVVENGARGGSERPNYHSECLTINVEKDERKSLLSAPDHDVKKESKEDGLKGRRSVSFCDLDGIDDPSSSVPLKCPASPLPGHKLQTGTMWHSLDAPVKTTRSVSFRDLKSISLDSGRGPSAPGCPGRGLSVPKRPALKKTRSVNEEDGTVGCSSSARRPSLGTTGCMTTAAKERSAVQSNQSTAPEAPLSKPATPITPIVDSSNLLSVPPKRSRPPAISPSKSTTSIEMSDTGPEKEKEDKGRLSKSTSCISTMCVTGSDSWSDHQVSPVPNLDLAPVRKMFSRQRSFTSLASSSPGSDRSGGSGASFFSNASFASIGLNTLRRFLKENGENVKALNKILRRDRRAARSLLLLVIVFFICWAPFSVINILGSICPGCVSKSAYSATCCLVWASAALNPFLYAYTSHRFRVHFQNLLCPCRKPKPQVTQATGRETTNIL